MPEDKLWNAETHPCITNVTFWYLCTRVFTGTVPEELIHRIPNNKEVCYVKEMSWVEGSYDASGLSLEAVVVNQAV